MQLLSIQYLRGVAALGVALFHLNFALNSLAYPVRLPDWLSTGVDVFFVISGFVMVIATGAGNETPLSFYRRRLVRIVPLYWILTSLTALMMIKPWVAGTDYDHEHLLASYLFVPMPHPQTGQVWPILIPGWTLNYEMFFYLLFGASLLLPRQRRCQAVLAALVGLVGLGFLAAPVGVAARFYTSPILLEFGAGVALGMAYLAGLRLPAGWSVLAIALGVLAIVGLGFEEDGPRVLSAGLPATLIVAGLVFLERARAIPDSAFARLLGDASYSLYLSHTMVYSVLRKVFAVAGLDAHPGLWPVFLALAVVLALAGGIGLHLVVERPMIQLFRQRRTALALRQA